MDFPVPRAELHEEIDRLRNKLKQNTDQLEAKDAQILNIKSTFEAEREKFLTDNKELQSRYEILLANHHHVAKMNDELEARLLETIEVKNNENKSVHEKLETVKQQLEACKQQLATVLAERDRYKEDCSVAVNLLQTNPDHFYSQTSKGLGSQPDSSKVKDLTVEGDCSQPLPFVLSSLMPTFPPIGFTSGFSHSGKT